MVNNKKFGIVFGREDRGLSRNSILYCDYMVDFQLPGYQKSMNLSHAIAFVLSSFHTYKENNPTPLDSFPERNKTHFYEYSKSIFKILGMEEFHNNRSCLVKYSHLVSLHFSLQFHCIHLSRCFGYLRIINVRKNGQIQFC